MINLSGTVTLSSVGEVSENGVKYRWIELHSDVSQNGRKHKFIWKILIAEKDLGPKAKGMPEIVRGYQKMNDTDPTELSDFLKRRKGPLFVFFGGDPKSAKAVKGEKVIDFQNGQLKIAASSEDSFEYNPFKESESVKSQVQRTVWKHEKVPFGTAKMNVNANLINVQAMGPKKIKMTFELLEFGKDAKSSLPDLY